MFIPFFLELKAARVPVSLREYLLLLEGLEAGLVDYDVEGFYYLARAALVKDECHIDRFDQVFAHVFKGVEALSGPNAVNVADIPEEWLRRLAEKHLTEEEKKLVAALGGFEKLMETLKQRLEEQKGRHQGGSKWIGTGGTSPFGAYGYNPEGVRIGQHESRNRRAVKVWDRREFRNFDDAVELGTRNIKIALKRLRRWVREGAEEEFDLPGTIHATAEHGYLDVKTRPERRNAVKLLMFFDVGGSMDDHIRSVEELFSAARAEFRQLEYFYFHNCLYEGVWKDNRRRHAETIPTFDLLHKYGPDYKVIVVGDASMSPYEIAHPGGSVEHWNPEAGAVWLGRLLRQWPNAVWLNPESQKNWGFTHSIAMIRDMFGGRMFPLTLAGLEGATRQLSRKH
ncbi:MULTISPECIES: vWA domain-containing protein [unclassified Mesorhizobium]|uniref:vWA domain-containing protein n=1 Tax=unclassified Mesorhizobium TaxID=325217 RepID=UPI00112D5C5E|nr:MULTISPECIES: VWA domain-containing protein [unclassified Mesorhizobium]TPJ50240.1 VWA domain-containing protein [Mesorhizobium sp. B2-6-6]MCA0001748.1 VWA domain-containing protein [Mesorhizobium sp. B264B2A]MCA0007855.1 VWA domain-containing protein [Mesorhizobium sp. B264B1B]MCA0017424.1 VWA domain-containing protein [Mesorhizobium sp. B264B1A]TPN62642.1 VWA domain-containing protein [Mesorhizobium sp. B1-1-1]